MSGPADLYRDWLRIPEGPRPPDHYTLLGLERGEADLAKIHAAADERIRIVRPRALKFRETATQLLNEIAQARVCLTDPEEKAAYDQELTAASADATQMSQLQARFGFVAEESSRAAVAAERLLGGDDWGLAPLSLSPTELAREAEKEEKRRKAALEAEKEDAAPIRLVRPPDMAEAPDVAEPAEPIDAPDEAALGPARWCPHCGDKLLPHATFCDACLPTGAPKLEWDKIRCVGCTRRLPAGMVVCRHCKHDHALVGERPERVARVGGAKPFAAAKASGMMPDTTPEGTKSAVGQRPAVKGGGAAAGATKPTLAKDTDTDSEAEPAATVDPKVVLIAIGALFGFLILSMLLGVGLMRAISPKSPAGATPAVAVNPNTPAAAPPARATPAGAQPPGSAPGSGLGSAVPGMRVPQPGAPPGGGGGAAAGTGPAAGDTNAILEAGDKALNDASASPEDLLKHHLAVAKLEIPSRSRLSGRYTLAGRLLSMAQRRKSDELQKLVASSAGDDDFRKVQAILDDIRSDAEKKRLLDDYTATSIRSSLQTSWLADCRSRLGKEFDARIKALEINEGLNTVATELPAELNTWRKSWDIEIQTQRNRLISAWTSQLMTDVQSLIVGREFVKALDLIDAAPSGVDPVPAALTTALSSLHNSVLVQMRIRWPTMLADGNFEELTDLLAALEKREGEPKPVDEEVPKPVGRETRKTFGRKTPFQQVSPAKDLRTLLETEGVVAPPMTKSMRPGAKVLSYAEPKFDHAAAKARMASRCLGKEESAAFERHYARLYNKHSHRAGYFVLTPVSGDERVVCSGLARAAFEAMKLEERMEKKGIKSEWSSTREKAEEP